MVERQRDRQDSMMDPCVVEMLQLHSHSGEDVDKIGELIVDSVPEFLA